ncbi:hypothetical protein P167DRAFT_564141 [Morchella conica CCBAS932]|uniref:Mitochondrial chaperone BCS1 n=2 Tax=Morchella sect. Distantes TaxID=1051054 RepID=A0A3N4KTU4_9PEZI|nr:hypothetical protein P167DRAFT_564141 [Morchella conica CCBAS932]
MNSLFAAKAGKPPPENAAPAAAPNGAPQTPGGDAGANTFMDQLTANPLFTGGIGLILLTGAAQLARKSVTTAATHLRRQMLVTLEIPSTDRSYDWFLHWMSTHQQTQQQQSLLNLPTPAPRTLSSLISRLQPQPRKLAVETKVTQHSSGSFTTDFSLLPGTGRHLINYRGTFLRVERERDAKRVDLQRGTPWEVLTITTLFSARHVFPLLLKEAQELAVRLEEGKTIIYTAWSTEWKPFGKPRRKRGLASVVLARGVKERIVGDVKSFLRSAQWYYDRGIPYRRGYLLYGPPGTGKSSFIQALAGELDYSICLLNLSERGLTDDRLNHLLTKLPERSIALLEDVDAAFGNRRTQSDEDGYQGANVTFSGLLNALDGVASSEERIVIMTTNHPERLDEALVRPGRVDVRAEIGYATVEVVEEMWERFYGRDSIGVEVPAAKTVAIGEAEAEAEVQMEKGELDIEEEIERRKACKKEFVKRLTELGAFKGEGWGIITAALQGLFVYFKGDPERAVLEAEALIPQGVKGEKN